MFNFKTQPKTVFGLQRGVSAESNNKMV